MSPHAKTALRVLCQFEGCQRLAPRHHRKNPDGSWKYHKYCGFHNSQGVNRRREYIAQYRGERRAENHRNILAYLSSHPCSDCGEPDAVVLEFDHRHGQKREMISRVLSSWNWEKILTEILKCDVICANCHRRRTAKDQQWHKLPKAA